MAVEDLGWSSALMRSDVTEVFYVVLRLVISSVVVIVTDTFNSGTVDTNSSKQMWISGCVSHPCGGWICGEALKSEGTRRVIRFQS